MNPERPHVAGAPLSDPVTLRMHRRTFLELASATVLATAGASALGRTAAAQSPAPTAAISDIVADLAASLGHDPERIFRWVQEEVRYEPYPGVLRGAEGTLLARAGSSADQAVLLADLLSASSVPVRYVTGSLDPAASDALMASTEVDTETARQVIERAVLSEADLAAGIHPDIPPADEPSDDVLSQEVMAQILAAAEADQEAMGRVARDQLESTLGQLVAALASTGVELPTSVSPMPEMERERHLWLQADVGTGWLDMDPAFPAAVPGDAIGTPVDTLDAVPDDLRHRVDFAVLAESFFGGALTKEAILRWDAFADELAYQGIALGFIRPDAAPDVNFLGAGLSDAATYAPALFVGDSAFLAPRYVSIGGSGGGGGGLFGDALGGGGGGLTDGETTAVWLEVGITVPSSAPRVARRTVFDRIGQTLRDGGVVDPYAIPPAELVDLGPGQDAEYLPCGAVYAFSVNGSTLNLKALIEGVDYRSPGVGSLLAAGWQCTRDQLRSDLVDAIGSLPFDDAPSVVAWAVTPKPDGSELRQDILHRTFGTLALTDRTPGAPPALVAGVLGHVAERSQAGDGLPSGDLVGHSPLSVGALFQMAQDQGIPLQALTAGVPLEMSLEAETAALIRTALDGGSIVVLPERALDVGGSPRLGWWVIDPLTGAAVDQLDDGGGAVTEEGLVQTFNAAEWSAARAIGQNLSQRSVINIMRSMANDPTITTRGLQTLLRVIRISGRYRY
jgi:hypothetical protein